MPVENARYAKDVLVLIVYSRFALRPVEIFDLPSDVRSVDCTSNVDVDSGRRRRRDSTSDVRCRISARYDSALIFLETSALYKLFTYLLTYTAECQNT